MLKTGDERLKEGAKTRNHSHEIILATVKERNVRKKWRKNNAHSRYDKKKQNLNKFRLSLQTNRMECNVKREIKKNKKPSFGSHRVTIIKF